MAVSDIKPDNVPDNLFPVFAKGGGGFNVLALPPQQVMEKKEEDLSVALDRHLKRKLAVAEVSQLVSEIGPPSDSKPIYQKDTAPTKKFLVDPDTGRIDIDLEGDLTLREAQVLSASIKAKSGDYDGAIHLIEAAKALAPTPNVATTEQRPREWYVDDDGVIQRDPESGDLTLSEARTVSQSHPKRQQAGSQETFTPEKLELMLRDRDDALKKDMTTAINSVKGELSSQDTALKMDDQGNIGLDPNRRQTTNDILLFMAMRKPQMPYRDSTGNVYASIPEFLEVEGFKGEQHRKQEMHQSIMGLIGEGKKELPELAKTIKELRFRGRGTKEKEAPEKEPTANEGPCAGCHQPISFTSTPTIVTCPNCKSINIFGTPEERSALMKQLESSVGTQEITPEVTKIAPETLEEKKSDTLASADSEAASIRGSEEAEAEADRIKALEHEAKLAEEASKVEEITPEEPEPRYVQVLDLETDRWQIVDRSTVEVIKTKKSPGPYKDVPLDPVPYKFAPGN